MSVPSILSTFLSFLPGFREVDGGDCQRLAQIVVGYQNAITATAAGTQANSFVLTQANNEVGTVASDNDSVQLPPAIPGLECYVNNAGGHTLKLWGNNSNVNNAGLADAISPHNAVATASSATQSTGVPAIYKCTTLGIWKQLLSG